MALVPPKKRLYANKSILYSKKRKKRAEARSVLFLVGEKVEKKPTDYFTYQ